MNIELIKQIAMVFIQWGFGFILCGLATVAIGLIILLCLDMKTISRISRFLNN
ncbi:hypothetical protein ACN077_20900 [Clostridium chromiireducens]|uniref:hypothetical protein n=1 Tax=Clostridium chromiireducens TaxID=225345 RepID=UPI003AF8C8A0